MVKRTHSTSNCASNATVGDSEACTVLLADDNPDIREVLRLWLTEDGHWDVREAENGSEALEKLDGTIDVLVLDREMPEADGSTVVERLTETEFTVNIFVVSGRPPDWRLDENDVTSYATKPIERDEFIDQLEQTHR